LNQKKKKRREGGRGRGEMMGIKRETNVFEVSSVGLLLVSLVPIVGKLNAPSDAK